ncbi:hypothetical protein E2C01_062037 [Portunus trituberculatus]|uniref:Uncharacterized protein n=1 Tax=Portunus trituberculatus TaxID=210409 RepID=A0A5B7H5F4_PORTR|nr:hypothetical protein [Portunus trituberculatus]
MYACCVRACASTPSKQSRSARRAKKKEELERK